MCSKIKFGTKAETLEAVSPLIRSALVLPQFRFSWNDWVVSRESILEGFYSNGWSDKELIVRSSALNEDVFGKSNAGKYLSLSGVTTRDQLVEAIERVFASYNEVQSENQVLIQPMMRDLVASGVARSFDPITGSPYRVLSWSDGLTSGGVTSGKDCNLNCWYITKQEDDCCSSNPILATVLGLIDEMESLAASCSFEIEFGIQNDYSIILFQLRRLESPLHTNIIEHSNALHSIVHKLGQVAERDSRILGHGVLLGVMSDWNPAEMIGVCPRPLDSSLYEWLITDHVWAEQRYAYGYRDLRGVPLMIQVYNHAFIDIRASFTSFIPSQLSDSIALSLATSYATKLRRLPYLHDKIEFEIVLSCLSFDTVERMNSLIEDGFDPRDCIALQGSLTELTNDIVKNKAFWREELTKIEYLRSKHFGLGSVSPLIRTRILLEHCREFGTRPFAGLARCSFIAIEFLRSAVRKGVMSEEEVNSLLASLDTVSTKIKRDQLSLNLDSFLNLYGHLRPGTYDILSDRYDESPEKYFYGIRQEGIPFAPAPYVAANDLKRRLDSALSDAGFTFDHQLLIEFISRAVIGREDAKFDFSRCLSDAMVSLVEWGQQIGLSREILAFIDIKALLNASVDDVTATMLLIEATNRREYEKARSIVLPSLIREVNDPWCFEVIKDEPNFVTQKIARGRVAVIDRRDSPDDAIVFITGADPGYDWIFTRGIRGFVTMYGGVNSHMALRSIELGIPAVIGCGEMRFRQLITSEFVEIDGSARTIRNI